MRLRDDIDPQNTWVTSDSHFGHDNIVGFCHRPLDHEQVMIAEWRAQVPEDATVIHLGDLCYKGNSFFKHITAKELTGTRKLLIMGNHDRQRPSFYKTAGFQIVKPFEIEWKWWRVSFSHYPMSAEEREHKPDGLPFLRLHGHIHNNGYSRDEFVPFLRDHINLSVEQTKYRPVNLERLLQAALRGNYSESTPEQLADAAARKKEAMS